MASVYFAVFAVLFTACAAQTGSILPVNITEAVVRGQTPGVCPSDQMLDSQYTATFGEINRALADTVAPVINCPCGGAGQWTRVAGLDFSDATVPCPSGFVTITSGGVRGCGRTGGGGAGCNGINFPSNGVTYSRVCGRVYGYQYASVDGLAGSNRGQRNLEQPYVDGVSITYGPAGSRQHVWTFVGALVEAGGGTAVNSCDCINPGANWPFMVPSFIGNNYFCATGNRGPGWGRQLYPDDPLWDGQGCTGANACCDFNNPPWFCTALPNPTSANLEVRVCHDQAQGDEDTVLGLVDIFVM